MTRGRRPDGSRMADKVAITDPEQRQRLRLILATIAGECSVADAAAKLGITAEAFRRLRWRAVAAMAEGVEARPPGPAPAIPDASELSAQVADLESEVDELRLALECQRVREEIAATKPEHLVDSEKNGRHRARAVHWKQRLRRQRDDA